MRYAVAVLMFLPTVALVAAEKRPEAGLINTVDRTFQSRFEKIDLKMFGVRRVPVTPEHEQLNRFSPETPEDKRLTSSLTESGWEAAFYVAGRKALRWVVAVEDLKTRVGKEAPKPDEARSLEWYSNHSVSKPIRLNKPAPGTGPLPAQDALLPRVREAFKEFADKKVSFEFQEAGWHVVARPIPASKQECLNCHKQDEKGKALKVGDPLGVAFYAFARAGEGKAPQQAAQAVKPRPKQQTGSLR